MFHVKQWNRKVAWFSVMDVNSIVALNNLTGIFMVIIGLVVLLYVFVIYMLVKLSKLNKAYHTMMKGATGENLEQSLNNFIAETQRVAAENVVLKKEQERMDALLKTAFTRRGIVRFRAFDDMGGDLSYAVALLDSDNNGVVFSSLFARDASRAYAKPILHGQSTYTLTTEEEQALMDAMKA